jgi:hypothetical protein
MTINKNGVLLTINKNGVLLTINKNGALVTVNKNGVLLTINKNGVLLTVNKNGALLTVNKHGNISICSRTPATTRYKLFYGRSCGKGSLTSVSAQIHFYSKRPHVITKHEQHKHGQYNSRVSECS